MEFIIAMYIVGLVIVGWIAAGWIAELRSVGKLEENYTIPMWVFVTTAWPATLASLFIYGMICFYVIGYRSLFGKKYG